MQLIGNSRALIRDAVRRLNPDIGGRKVNDLSKDELLAVAARYNVDAAAIVEGVRTGRHPGAITPARAAQITAQTIARVEANGVAVSDETRDELIRDAIEDATDVGDMENDPVAAIEAEALALRRELGRAMGEGDFDTVTSRLAALLTEAHKPAVVQYLYGDPSPTMTMPQPAAPPFIPAPVRVDTWGTLFNVKGTMSGRKINVYTPHPTTPCVDAKYRWPEQVTPAALASLGRGRNIWLYGPAGTGKTSFGEQLAARTGRPFFLIPCDDTTEAPELVGMTVPSRDSVRWQDGVLTAAMRVPHAIILIDEPTVARAGAVMVLQSVLQSRVLSIKETGELVKAPDSIRFIVADNTNGTGGGNAEGYEGTRRMNRATLDRFSVFLRVDYMKPADEIAALVAHTSCTKELAKMLVECAGLSRKAKVTHAIGLRRLLAWAEMLTEGFDPRVAFEISVLNSCARDDREPTEQCCALGLDNGAIAAALLGQSAPAPVVLAPSVLDNLSRAAADFADRG